MNFLKRLFTRKKKYTIFTLRLSKENCERILAGHVIERELRLNNGYSDSWVHISIDK